MGVHSVTSTLYSIKNVTVSQAKNVLEIVRVDDSAEVRPENTAFLPQMDVDISWILKKVAGSKSPEEAAMLVAEILETFAHLGFIVQPICDGPIRHHSKRASMDRVAKREKDALKCAVARFELLASTQALRDNPEPQEKDRLQNKLKDLDKLITRLEKSTTNQKGVSLTFATDLQEELTVRGSFDAEDKRIGKILPVKTGMFQADPLIAYRAIHNKSDVILASDSDFFVSIGQKCVLIKDFVFKRKRRMTKHTLQDGNDVLMMDIQQVTLGCCSASMRDEIEQALQQQGNNAVDNIIFKDAKYPIFDQLVVRLRVLCAVILGCDVFMGGIDSVGPKSLYDKIKELKVEHDDDNDQVLNALQEWACTIKRGFDRNLLNVFIDCIIFEPANEVNRNGNVIFEDDNNKIYTYLHMRPPLLPKYAEEFWYKENDNIHIHNQCQITDGPELCTCVGPRRNTGHIVMRNDNIKKCHGCNQWVCSSCRMSSEANTSNLLCLPCYGVEKMLPYDHDPNLVDNNNNVPISTMHSQLRENGFDLEAGASVHEVEEIYETYIQKKTLHDITNLDNIPFPRKPAHEIDCILDGTYANIIGDLNFCEGGQFISDVALFPDDMLPGILNLFAVLVEYKENLRYTTFKHKIYDALPSYFVEIANGARKNSGFRLLRRCARHAMDSNVRCLVETIGKIARDENGSVGLFVQNIMPASMKASKYNTYAFFTASDLVACKCNCQCCAQDDEAIVCVHILPLIFQVSLLLVEGFAENILLELCARFGKENENRMSAGNVKSMKNSITTLMGAVGLMDDFTSFSVHDMLSRFSVSTERQKKSNNGAPKTSLICSLVDLPHNGLISNENKVMKRMGRPTKKKEKNITSYKSAGSAVVDNEKVVLKRNKYHTYDSIPCNCCASGIPTSHRCQQKKNQQYFF